MQTKQALTVLGTLLFLFGVFGYLFPEWGNTYFTNNENLFHVLTSFVALLMASASFVYRRWALLGLALVYLALSLYGFTLKKPTDFHLGDWRAQLDMFDNYAHAIIALAFAWFWLANKKA